MSTTDFTPERSAAIRQLLLDTVADEPRRRKRLQVLLTSVLSAVAIVLAGGTAALALAGVIHLGGGDTPPAPVPAPTQTVTPTPAPTPTPTPTVKPLVQSAPVLPHDVDSLRATTRWSLDLPGDPECTTADSYTLSDARVIYVSGLRPKEYEGSDCINHLGEDMAVTLVDTSSGAIVWQREWKFTPKWIAFGASFQVLGTSGRGVFASRDASVGPHDVLDLATGETVGTFQPDWADFQPSRDMLPVPGNSGDLITIRHSVGSDGRPTADDVLTRANPADFSHPMWSRSLGVRSADLGSMPLAGTAMTISNGLDAQGKPTKTLMVDLKTGDTTEIDADEVDEMSQALAGVTYGQSGAAGELTGYGPDGAKLWSRPLPPAAWFSAVSTPGIMPGMVDGYRTGDTGEFILGDTHSLTLIDQATGVDRWTIPTPACVESGPPWDAELDVTRDVIMLDSRQVDCAVSHGSGASVDAPAIPREPFYHVFGLTNRYQYADTGPGKALDLATRDTIWTRERQTSEVWAFDGGYLVAHRLNHIESIG